MKRLPTLIPGLDSILKGGLFEGGVYICEGPPGVGKTTLANQIAYSHARDGSKTLYVTMLAESHARLLQHMKDQTFFDQKAVNSKVFYISGYRDFEQHGLKGVIALVHGELARSGASILVIDGLVVERDTDTDGAVRQFVHELQSLVTAMNCTCLVLTSGPGNSLSAEQTMVDGIFAFEDASYRWRAERRLQVRKFRGSEVARGQHTFCITDEGVHLYPRLESVAFDQEPLELGPGVLSMGIRSLDEILHGRGILSGSSSAVIGQSGSGKTLFGLSFAAAATPVGSSLMVSSTQARCDLVNVAGQFGIAVQKRVDTGELVVERLGFEDESLDQIGHTLLRQVEQFNVKRLVIDGLAGFGDTLAFPDRGYRFLGRLLREFRQREVTSLFTIDPQAMAVTTGMPLTDGLMGWFDNVFDLPYHEGEQRLVSIRKLRAGRLQTVDTSPHVPFQLFAQH